MIYEFPITTTIDYTIAKPKRTVIRLSRGVIHQLDIIADEAVMGTLYVAICHGLHQLYPTNSNEFFRLTGRPFSFREGYKLYTKPFSLYVYTYLKDAQKEHELRIRMGFLLDDDIRGVRILWDEEAERRI